MPNTVNIHQYADDTALFSACADAWIQRARDSIAQRGRFRVALAGGSTPKGLYRCLAEPTRSAQLDWRQVEIYFGDERAVPPDHADSNYRMACEAMLAHPPIDVARCHPMRAHPDTIERDAQAYADLLSDGLPRARDGAPQFDLILLGLGSDGHTASLFPGTAALTERERWVTPVYVEPMQSWRLTLTYPVLNAAHAVWFLVQGEAKATVVAEILQGNADYPAAQVQPTGGAHWYLDDKAAMRITQSG